MKLIALDVGTKRIGVAKADSKVRIAIPYSAIEVDGTEFDKIASLARAWDINSFVLGLPRNSHGEETEQSRYVRQFAKELKQAVPGAKICFQDESLTSVEAEKRLKNRKKGYKKGDIDSEAATIILQDFLEEKTGKSTSRATSAHRKSVKAAKPRRSLSVVVALFIILGLGATAGYGYYRYNMRPVAEIDCSAVDADVCDDTLFAVESGMGVRDIASELKEADLIRDPLVFQIHFYLNSHGKSLKAGEYQLNQAMSLAEITSLLLKGGSENVFTLTIFPGENIFQIKQKLISLGYTEEEIAVGFSAEYHNSAYDWIFDGRPEDATSYEGYVYGETYEFYRDDTVEEILETTFREMAKALEANDLKAKFEARGLTLYQGITLASIVQKEANNAADMAKVAQVFYNRMEQGWNLGSDVTTIYAIDLVDPERLSGMTEEEKINFESPYNTRFPGMIGLPYGPISNPGIEALNAVATPDESAKEFMFFLTGDDGLMYYSSTDAEHQQNIADHCAYLCNVAL